MRKTRQTSGERIVKDIKRKTRKRYSAEEKIRIVLDGLRGEESVAELCRQEGISQAMCHNFRFARATKSNLTVLTYCFIYIFLHCAVPCGGTIFSIKSTP